VAVILVVDEEVVAAVVSVAAATTTMIIRAEVAQDADTMVAAGMEATSKDAPVVAEMDADATTTMDTMLGTSIAIRTITVKDSLTLITAGRSPKVTTSVDLIRQMAGNPDAQLLTGMLLHEAVGIDVSRKDLQEVHHPTT